MKQFEIVLPCERGDAEFKRVLDIMYEHCKPGCIMYARHPKDEVASFEHWHLGGQLKSDNTPETIAKWFGFQPNSIERIKSHFKTYAVYLAHKTKDAISVGKSAPVDIGGSFDYQGAIRDYENNGRVASIIDDVLSGKLTEYDLNTDTDLVGLCIKQGIWRKVQDALKVRQNAESVKRMNGEKDIKVAWICGSAGVGKTTLAKSMAGGKPFYVTSSGKNPFDNYLGQPVVIIDDIDKDTASGKALLKLLDPHTDTLTACRYANKMITADTIIVTSTVPPDMWWNDNASDSDGNKYQLLRRLTLGTWLLGDGKGEMTMIIYDGNGFEVLRQSAEFPREVLEKRERDTVKMRVNNVNLMLGQLGVSLHSDAIEVDTSGFRDIDPNQLDIADIFRDGARTIDAPVPGGSSKTPKTAKSSKTVKTDKSTTKTTRRPKNAK